MTFRDFYNKLLSDPNFGKITHRHAQHKAGYIEGMNRVKEVISKMELLEQLDNCLEQIDEAIAEESK